MLMKRKRRSPAPQDPVSKAELAVIKVLWDRGSATVREIHTVFEESGHDWAYTTVLTLLQRLQTKGYVKSQKRGIALEFTACVSREKLVRHRLWEIAEQLTDGAASPLLHALLNGERFSSDEIEEFRQLLDRAEPERRPRRGKKK